MLRLSTNTVCLCWIWGRK